MESESFKIIQGDAYQIIKRLSAGGRKFRAIITSPYYGHQHYGSDRQKIGREQTVGGYLDSLV